MFSDVIVNSMRLPVIAVIALATFSLAELDLRGAECGEKRCNVSEYCSPFDMHCRPCSVACDVNSHNYQPEECTKDCQGESSIQHQYTIVFYGLKLSKKTIIIYFLRSIGGFQILRSWQIFLRSNISRYFDSSLVNLNL